MKWNEFRNIMHFSLVSLFLCVHCRVMARTFSSFGRRRVREIELSSTVLQWNEAERPPCTKHHVKRRGSEDKQRSREKHRNEFIFLGLFICVPGQIVSDLLSWGFLSVETVEQIVKINTNPTGVDWVKTQKAASKRGIFGKDEHNKNLRRHEQHLKCSRKMRSLLFLNFHFSVPYIAVFAPIISENAERRDWHRLQKKQQQRSLLSSSPFLTSWSAISFNQTQKDNLQFLRPDEPLFIADCSYPEPTDDVCRERDVWGGKKLRTEDMCLNLSYLTFNIEM